MVTAGVVAEYNPFHNGHLYHLNKVRQSGATHIAVVMSGNYVQRGDTAIASKFARANAAVKSGGADLVLELPSAYALLSAQEFAENAVYLLNSLGCIDMLCFGCESGSADDFLKIAKATLSDEYGRCLSELMSTGISYPAAAEKAVLSLLGKSFSDLVKTPNNILAIQYVRALLKLGSKAEPLAVIRSGAGHDKLSEADNMTSAMNIRGMILRRGIDESIAPFVPKETYDILKNEARVGKAPCDYKRAELAVLSKLRCLPPEFYENIPDVSEGLQNRIAQAVNTSGSLNALMESIKTKRYTHSRIRRIILRSYLSLTRDYSDSPPPYIRVLALNEKGCEILKKAKKSCPLPIIVKSSHALNSDDPKVKKLFLKEAELTNQFFLTSPEIMPCGSEFTENLKLHKCVF